MFILLSILLFTWIFLCIILWTSLLGMVYVGPGVQLFLWSAGGATGPLFKFKMVPIGKRRTWRDVMQRQNFNPELMQ